MDPPEEVKNFMCMADGKFKPVIVIRPDNGPDHCVRHKICINSYIDLAKFADADFLIVPT